MFQIKFIPRGMLLRPPLLMMGSFLDGFSKREWNLSGLSNCDLVDLVGLLLSEVVLNLTEKVWEGAER